MEDFEGAAGLGDRLVMAALDRLRSTPGDAISMRVVAQDVGVSHQAPYVHFGSKRRFLAAVAGVGLQEAAERAAASIEAAGADPYDRLHALADAYLAFVRTNPHLHDLAYGPAVDKGDHPLLQNAAITYWNLLHDAVAGCQPFGTTEQEVLSRSATLWGTTYGIARLAIFGQIPLSVPDDSDHRVHDAVDALILGWRARAQPS